MALTPDQIAALGAWADERDAILLDISKKRSEQEQLSRANDGLSEKHTQYLDDIAACRGRLEAMTEYEEERSRLVSTELAQKSKDRAELELVIAKETADIALLEDKKSKILSDLEILIPVYERVAFQIGALNQTVDKVVKINSNNIKEVNNMIDNVKKGIVQPALKKMEARKAAQEAAPVKDVPRISINFNPDKIVSDEK